MAKAEPDYNAEGLDVCLDQMFELVDKLQGFVGQLETTNTPQMAAKDKMNEIIDRALKPYLSEFAQCSDIFEQGIE